MSKAQRLSFPEERETSSIHGISRHALAYKELKQPSRPPIYINNSLTNQQDVYYNYKNQVFVDLHKKRLYFLCD